MLPPTAAAHHEHTWQLKRQVPFGGTKLPPSAAAHHEHTAGAPQAQGWRVVVRVVTVLTVEAVLLLVIDVALKVVRVVVHVVVLVNVGAAACNMTP